MSKRSMKVLPVEDAVVLSATLYVDPG